MAKETDLSKKMRKLARAGHDRGTELYLAATALDEATDDYATGRKVDQMQTFLAAWSKARRVWCECTGEAL